ncbi:hypothetical protein PRIC2_012389 [Phytophthora ramorum]
MQDESEMLDAVCSFLAQFDLPTDLAALVDAEHEVADVPVESLPSALGVLHEGTTCLTAKTIGNSSTQEVAASPATSEESTQVANTKEPKKTRRISQKEHIETARKEIQDLNAELQTLTRLRQERVVLRNPPLWQKIAARQLVRRQHSEEENVKLREMMKIQVQEAINLRRLLKRRTKIEMMENMLGTKRLRAESFSVPKDNPQVFEAMLQDTDELYVGVDTLFKEKGLYELPCPGRRSDARRNMANGLFLELLQRHVVPFGLRTTEKAMWKAMHQIAFQGLDAVKDFQPDVQFHSHYIEETQDTMKTSFSVDTSNLDELRGAQLRMVYRKYVEEDRVVIIGKALMEPLLYDKSKTSGFHSRTTMRIVIRRDNSHVGEDKVATLIESHFSATRFDQGCPAASAIRKSPNLDVGIAAWDEAISRIAHQVESLVIDGACEDVST